MLHQFRSVAFLKLPTSSLLTVLVVIVCSCSSSLTFNAPPPNAAERDAAPTPPPLSDEERTFSEPGSVVSRGETAKVAFDGARYLVVWRELSQDSYSAPHLRAARVARDGTVLDLPAIILPGVSPPGPIAVAGRDGQFMVAFTGFSSRDYHAKETALSVRIRGSDGAMLDSEPRFISHAIYGLERSGGLAATPTGYVAGFESTAFGGLFVTHLKRDGTPSRYAEIASPTATGARRNASVAWGEGSGLLVWEERVPTDAFGPANVRAASVTLDEREQARVSEPWTLASVDLGTEMRDLTPQVAYSHGTYFVAWSEDQPGSPDPRPPTMRGYHLDALTFATRENAPVTWVGRGSSSNKRIAVTGEPTSEFVVFDAFAAGSNSPYYPISTTVVPGGGGARAPTPLSMLRTPVANSDWDVAFDGTRFLVVYRDAFEWTISAAFVDSATSPTASSPFPISYDPATQTHPRVATNGSSYFVSWVEDGNVLGMRVRASDGVFLDASPKVIVDSSFLRGEETALASDGKGYLVVANRELPDHTWRVTLARVAADGSQLPSVDLVAPNAVDRGLLQAASNGEIYLVLWNAGPEYQINAMRFDGRTGRFLDDAPLVLPFYSKVAVASDGRDFVVATGTVSTVRVSALDGGVSQPTAVASGRITAPPTIGYVAGRYVLGWTQRSEETELDVWGTFLDADGRRSSADSFLIANAPADQVGGSIHPDGNGFWVSWTTRNGEHWTGPRQVVPIVDFDARYMSLDGEPITPSRTLGSSRDLLGIAGGGWDTGAAESASASRGTTFVVYDRAGLARGRFLVRESPVL